MKKEIINLRELGGLKGLEGKTVKSNLLYRSGNLNIDKMHMHDTLSALKIHAVYDLRSEHETKKEPYLLPQYIKYKKRPVLKMLEDQFKALHISDEEIRLSNGKTNFMSNIYESMATNPETFGEIIKEIIQDDGKPILFHCSAGKDRTGILASFILLALGVAKNDVFEHYMLSNEYRKDENEKMLALFKKTNNNSDDIDILKEVILVKEDYINSIFDIIEQYDSFVDYAQDKLKLSKEDIYKLRFLYLE